ncbi:A/G-specific adenine glycosylase [Castellaniella sp.]|uniref:A/G-specific adenine glycosylase n=1 Tax=Castellaniella sp. TaxID=1955812 RepID=UPI002AFE3CEA|nr:A/G-specific adenine glycosylase [Castellaniella sp.]
MAAADPASRIAAWQKQSGRHGLPWQHTRDPYRIWLSEVMLQQTQAATVIPYYQRFLEKFPTVTDLADAPADAVLHAWAGLGYYARARNLHRCAQTVRDAHRGQFPSTAAALETLPGIGRSTASAIAAFAYGERAPILDGNVRRVLIRYLALAGDPGAAAMTRTLWTHAQSWLDQAPADLDMQAYTQGQMDLGAAVCTRSRPDCPRCPLAPDCAALRQGLQDTLPNPRVRRAQARHRCWMLILECDGRLWLQRRPAAGIWGGLWALPTFDSRAALDTACSQLPATTGAAQPLAAIEHVFTHFRLLIQPVRMQHPGPLSACQTLADPVCSHQQAASEQARNPAVIPVQAGESAWVPLGQLQTIGLPAPLSRLLSGLYPLAP